MNRYEHCGCVNPYLWNARGFILPDTNEIIFADLCNQSDFCYLQAINTFMLSESVSEHSCSNCKQQCLTTEFILQKSFLEIAFDWQIFGIKYFVENSNITLPVNWSTTWQEHIQANYLSLSVFSETDIVESQIQRATLTIVNVVSNIGGQTGLWIGISFLSMIELIEMIYHLLRYECHITRRISRVMPK